MSPNEHNKRECAIYYTILYYTILYYTAACQNPLSSRVTSHAAHLRFCAVRSASAEYTFCCFTYAPPSQNQSESLCAAYAPLMRRAYALCAPLMRHACFVLTYAPGLCALCAAYAPPCKNQAHTRMTRYLAYTWQSRGIGGLPDEMR